MKKCQVCGRENSDEARFCVGCGKDLRQEDDNNNNRKKSGGRKRRITYKRLMTWAIIIVCGVLVFLYNQGYLGRDITTYLILSSAQESFLRTGGDVDIEIETDGRRWEITHEPNWCYINEYSDSFEIRCYENNSGEDRTGWVTVTSGDYIARIDVVQRCKASYLNVSKSRLSTDHTGDSFNIEVETDGKEWSVRRPKYCEVEFDGNSFDLTIPYNHNESRSGYITVSSDEITHTISFYQGGKCSYCSGSGEVTCSNCYGRGQVYSGVNYYGITYSDCPVCDGSGKMECSACDGSGWDD